MATKIVVHPIPTLRRAVLAVLLKRVEVVSSITGIGAKELQKIADTVLLKWSADTCFFCGSRVEPLTGTRKVVPGTPACECLQGTIPSFETWLVSVQRASYYREHLKGWQLNLSAIVDQAKAGELLPSVKLYTDRCCVPGCEREFTITVGHVMDAQKHLKGGAEYKRPKCCKPHAIERRKSRMLKATPKTPPSSHHRSKSEAKSLEEAL